MWKFRAVWTGSCQVLAVLGFGMLFLLAGPAWAEYENNPIPEVLGVKLGGDIRDYPGMEPARKFDGSITYERSSDEDATFNGIPIFAVGYNAYENRVGRIHFSIRHEYLDNILGYLSSKYGEFKIDDGNYWWHDFYFKIVVYFYEEENEYVIAFTYLPLVDKRKSDNLNFHELEYNDVFLNTHISKYSGMIPCVVLDHDMKFPPGHMAYMHFSENKQLTGKTSTIVYKTWRGLIYQIGIYFDTKDYERILVALQEKYKDWDAVFRREGNSSKWEFGEYELTMRPLLDNDARGMIRYRYWPLARQARIVEEEYRRLSDSY